MAKRLFYRRLLAVLAILAWTAVLIRILHCGYGQILVSGESLDVTRDGLLKRWEPWENVTQDEMGLYLSKGDADLEVLCAPSGPFQFTGDRLETPEGSIRRGQSRADVHAVLGEPFESWAAPEMGDEFSHEGHKRLNSFGTLVARFTVTYRNDQMYKVTAMREDRREEFKSAHGHRFHELRN